MSTRAVVEGDNSHIWASTLAILDHDLRPSNGSEDSGPCGAAGCFGSAQPECLLPNRDPRRVRGAESRPRVRCDLLIRPDSAERSAASTTKDTRNPSRKSGWIECCPLAIAFTKVARAVP